MDSFFPAGGFAFSSGLETAVQEGTLTDGKSLPAYLIALLRFGVGESDGIAVKISHQAVMINDLDLALSADRRLDGMKSCLEIREGSRQMGRQMMRIGGLHFDLPIIHEINHLTETRKTPCHAAVACGSLLAASRWSAHETVCGFLYQTIVGWVSASLRLLPLGHQEAQKILHELFPHCVEVARKVEQMGLEDMKSWVPLHDIRAMRHSHLRVRVFRS